MKKNETCCNCRDSSLARKAWILAICLLISGALEKRYQAVGKTTGKHFFFFGKSRLPWVREFWNCGWNLEFGFQSNCPVWPMSRETCLKRLWIWHQLRLFPHPAIGVVAEAWVVVDFGKMALGTRNVLCRAFHDAQFNPGDILEDLQTKLHDLSWAVWEPNRILRSMAWACWKRIWLSPMMRKLLIF